jgi:hypothetical protein
MTFFGGMIYFPSPIRPYQFVAKAVWVFRICAKPIAKKRSEVTLKFCEGIRAFHPFSTTINFGQKGSANGFLE